MHSFFPVIITCISSCLAFYASATVTSDQSALTTQREIFKKAEKQLWKANSSTYQNLYQQLENYPLKPYLDQKRLMHRMRISSAEEISKFLSVYEGTPLDWPLRKKWLNYLIKRNRQAMFLSFFKPTNDAELTCRYYQYQLNKGASEANILPKIEPLWVVGKSQPKACDPLFKRWEEAGLRTEEHVWQRLSKAADGGKHTLIPYLTTLLPDDEKYLGSLWHKVRKDPAYITKLTRFLNKNVKETAIFTYGIKRLIWRDPNRALKTYQKASQMFTFNDTQKQKIAYKFALALASKNHRSAKEWLVQVDEKYLTDNIIQWRMADVLRTQNWHEIKSELLSFPVSQQAKNQWKYWYARSLIETDQKQEGDKLMAELSQSRHYYGFLAASITDSPVNFQDKPLAFTADEKKNVLKNKTGQRAFEFFHLGRFYQARQEWNYWVSELSKKETLIAAKVANEQGWFDRAIFALSNVGYLDDVDLRFPLAFNDEINSHSVKHDINPAWAFAIARRESSFMTDAYSSVGARGLMQIMPDTAKQLTRRKKVPAKYLLDSTNNINLGTKYLKKLLDRNKGNQILATASYNAGPYRVKKWLKKSKKLPADIWIETIPFKETREYVKSVLAYQQIYQFKIGQEQAIFNQLPYEKISQL